LALGYGIKRRSRNKRENANCMEDTVTVFGLKRTKEKKIWSEAQERKPLDEDIRDDR
jgi:hypothetical protein